jgi:GNAT superfamily N-acetyltransferase
MAKKRKFEGVNFSEHKPIPWTPEFTGQGFRCLRGEFVSFFRKGRIENEISSHISRCWLVHTNEGMAGYITLLADKLSLEEAVLMNEGIKYQTFPAVKIGLLAADSRAKGVGHLLVEWAVQYVAQHLSPTLGIRYLTVDALYDDEISPHYDASGFYERLGFMFTNPKEALPKGGGTRSMFLDLKPLIDQLHNLPLHFSD